MSKDTLYRILYKVTLNLSTLNPESRRNLVSFLRTDKESNYLALVLLISSFLSNNIKSFEQFKKTYMVIVEAIHHGALTLNPLAQYRRSNPKEIYNRIRFRVNRVHNSDLLKLIINNPDITLVLTKKPFDIIYILRITKHLSTSLREEQFQLLNNSDLFKTYFLNSPLKEAIFCQDSERVKSIIASHYEITQELITPLILAILMNNTELVKVIVQHETEISRYNDYRAISFAATTENIEIFKLLVNTYHIPQKEYEEALLYATSSENIPLLKFFIDNHLISSENEDTLKKFLEYASIHDLKKIAHFFAPIMSRHSFSLDWQLKLALKRNSLATAAVYLLNGADINNNYYPGKNSLLHMACILGNLEMVKLLINHEAHIDAINDHLNKPTDLARAYEYDEIVSYLDAVKAKGKSLKVITKKGSPAKSHKNVSYLN